MKKSTCMIVSVLLTSLMFANEWSFSSVIMAQVPFVSKAKQVEKEGENHIAPITGLTVPVPMGMVSAKYQIPLNFGDSLLFQGANVTFEDSISLSPISIEDEISVSFSPIPILSLTAGASAGTAWNIMGIKGVAKYDSESDSYEALTPFANWKYSFFGRAGLQFDFGAIFPGEWTHVITTASYGVKYEGFTAADNKEPWSYAGGENVNGLTYSTSMFIGYMMPLRLKMIGLAASFNGRYSGDDYGVYDSNFDGDFMGTSFALQGVVALTEKDSLQIMTSLSSCRAFLEEVDSDDIKITKTKAGTEWVFGGIMLGWSHNF